MAPGRKATGANVAAHVLRLSTGSLPAGWRYGPFRPAKRPLSWLETGLFGMPNGRWHNFKMHKALRDIGCGAARLGHSRGSKPFPVLARRAPGNLLEHPVEVL